uniref:hypothetical protein n=1 Tax=uncultured Sphingomonas sp. TaxID=158754 RepID=UPI0025EFECCE|nr:hypothetical protein [uncultured Sphingomonas sp.]
MKTVRRTMLLVAASALLAGAGASAALAQRTPNNFRYEIKNGQRVPKPGNRLVRPDGSWREEVRQGSCVTIKEKSAAGEYKETRRCD